MKSSVLSIILFVTVFNSFAQTRLENKIDLNDSSISRTIALDIKKGTSEISFYIAGYLSDGWLSFLIADPEGKREGQFQLEAISDGKKGPGKGRMEHKVDRPIEGRWEIRIRTNHAKGNLSYKIIIE
jgi:hypothetical protein